MCLVPPPSLEYRGGNELIISKLHKITGLLSGDGFKISQQKYLIIRVVNLRFWDMSTQI